MENKEHIYLNNKPLKIDFSNNRYKVVWEIMVLDGLYMSLIGLAVVFMVLVFLLITINLLNYFDENHLRKLLKWIYINFK